MKIICSSPCLSVCFLSRLGLHLSQTSNGGTNRDGRRRRQRVGATGHYLTAGFAFPDSDACSLDIVFSTECTMVRAVLTNLNLLDELSECATVTSTVLSSDSDFLGAFSHCVCVIF